MWGGGGEGKGKGVGFGGGFGGGWKDGGVMKERDQWRKVGS